MVEAEHELPVAADEEEDVVRELVKGGAGEVTEDGLSTVVVVNVVAVVVSGVVVGCVEFVPLLLLRFLGVFCSSQCCGVVFSSLHCCCTSMLLTDA